MRSRNFSFSALSVPKYASVVLFCAATHARTALASGSSSHRYGSDTATPCSVSTTEPRAVCG